MTEAGSTYREHPSDVREFRNLCYGNTVAKLVCSSALDLLLSLVCCILRHLPKLLEAEQAGVALPVQHTLLKAHSGLALPKSGMRWPSWSSILL